jgi:hypothetical protein
MKKLFFIIAFLILISCGVKQTQFLLSAGNYDEAIANSVASLRSNKDKKGNQDYVYLLEEAFAKAKERDLNSLSLWEKEGNPANFEKIFNTYLLLNDRQEKIKPLLPLKVLKEGRNAIFPFDNYNNQIITTKNNLSNYLYNNAKLLMATSDKMNYRKAFDDLTYLNQINPNYKNILDLLDEAHFKGTDYVSVTMRNETNMIIPGRLLNELLNFNTYGLNDKWTIYHGDKQKGIDYDYGMVVYFREIYISPEQMNEREFIKERQINDGQKRLLDANGKEVLDRSGKPVLVDNIRTINVRIYETRQLKTSQIIAKVDYVDYRKNLLIQSFPLSSEYVFENVFSTFKGDRRASDDNYYYNFDKRALLFPTNEDMIFNTGEIFKDKLKNLFLRNAFRN